jgi:hypothetical protein
MSGLDRGYFYEREKSQTGTVSKSKNGQTTKENRAKIIGWRITDGKWWMDALDCG